MTDILIVDDHQMFIDGLKSLLEVIPDINKIYQALNGKDAIEICKNNRIDFVLMDISMPEMDGIEASKKILELKPEIKILMLTMFNDIKYIDEIVQTKVSGYILKNTGRKELFEAIKKVNNGGRYYSEEVTNNMYDSLKKPSKTKEKNTSEIKLTKREIEILKLITKEYTSPKIAEKLNISQYTVETHRKNLLKKLNVKNSVGLAIFAVEKGLI